MRFSGKKLQDAMTEKGLTVRGLAQIIGRHHSTVNSWTLGDSKPNSDDLANLMVATDKPFSFFYMANPNSLNCGPDTPETSPATAEATNEVTDGG